MESLLFISAITVVMRRKQEHRIIGEKIDTSAHRNAIASIGQRSYRLMNTLGGKAVLLGLLNGAGEIRSIKSGNEQYSPEIKNVYGAALLRNWKPTISSGGANIQNYDMRLAMVEHSV